MDHRKKFEKIKAMNDRNRQWSVWQTVLGVEIELEINKTQ